MLTSNARRLDLEITIGKSKRFKMFKDGRGVVKLN